MVYLWALLASQVMVNVLKHSIGTLRPNFFSICNPNITCSDSEVTKIYYTYYICQGISSKKEASFRTSFPSGHAAFSAAAALFLVIYIQIKMRKNISASCCGARNTTGTFIVLLGLSLQLVCLVLSCWTSILRVSEYKPHLLDVIVGYVLGGVIGIIAAYHALKWDRLDAARNCTNTHNKEGSGYSIQEIVVSNEECCQEKTEVRNDGDIEKGIEIEGGLNISNLNLTRQNTEITTESELNYT
jgi:membrane-associated phospholipid phosphatase